MSATAQSVLDSLTARESAGAVKNKANHIQAKSKGMEDEMIHTLTAGALSNLQDQINSLGNNVRTLAGVAAATGGGGGTATAGIAIDRHTLTANTTINASVLPSSTEELLIVFVTQNATGGWVATWNAASFSIAPTGLSTLANKKSVIIFADDGAGKWAMAAPPVTGR